MGDTLKSGIVLTGGGALMPGLTVCMSESVGLNVFIAEEPLSAVARGLGIILESFDTYTPVLLAVEQYADYF
jgi:rod shape-determining protein MreB